MNKKLNYIFLYLFLSIFISCDPGVINSFAVKNNSDYDLKITTKLCKEQRSINEIDSLKIILVQKGEEKEIIRYGEIGRAYDKNDSFLESVDLLQITNQNENININYLKRKNWKYQIVNKGYFSLDEVKYILLINNNNVK